MSSSGPVQVSVVLFDDFELLDVFGPCELLGVLPDRYELHLVGPRTGPVRSAQGPSVVCDRSYDDAPPPELALIPGGRGTRSLVQDRAFCDWLRAWAEPAQRLLSVCTGSGLLAAAGLLDGRRATSNKRAFAWAQAQSAEVEWVAQARWVEDGRCWTSSGVAAGMDMTLALIAEMHSEDLAVAVADGVELEWHRDPAWDPFAAKNGLVPG